MVVLKTYKNGVGSKHVCETNAVFCQTVQRGHLHSLALVGNNGDPLEACRSWSGKRQDKKFSSAPNMQRPPCRKATNNQGCRGPHGSQTCIIARNHSKSGVPS